MKRKSGYRIMMTIMAVASALTIIQSVRSQEQEEGEAKPEQTGIVAYVGTDKCMMCHSDKEEWWSGNGHNTKTAGVAEPEIKGCEACHGQGSLHAEAGGAKAHITNPGNKPKNEASDICLKCHGGKNNLAPKDWKNITESDWRKTRHYRKNVLCVKCHEMHGDKPKALKEKNPVDLCLTCHGDIAKAEGAGYVHSPVKQGKCLECHDPHGTSLPHMVRKGIGATCSKCHDTSAAKMVEKHGGFNVIGAQCTECHNPHAKETSRKLLRQFEHTGFKSRKCATCHKEKKENGAPASLNVKETCSKCHRGVVEDAETAAVKHFPVAEGLCTNCHSPHVSRSKEMLRDNMDVICATCHNKVSDQLAGIYEHPPVATGKCNSCHAPHGNSTEKFLKKDPDDLCRACHEKIQFAHPMKEQTKNPSMGKIIRCYTCHAVHGSDIKKLLPWSEVTLCNKCHGKDVSATVTPEGDAAEEDK